MERDAEKADEAVRVSSYHQRQLAECHIDDSKRNRTWHSRPQFHWTNRTRQEAYE